MVKGTILFSSLWVGLLFSLQCSMHSVTADMESLPRNLRETGLSSVSGWLGDYTVGDER